VRSSSPRCSRELADPQALLTEFADVSEQPLGQCPDANRLRNCAKRKTFLCNFIGFYFVVNSLFIYDV
jgi:hypothetical protein